VVGPTSRSIANRDAAKRLFRLRDYPGALILAGALSEDGTPWLKPQSAGLPDTPQQYLLPSEPTLSALVDPPDLAAGS